MSKTRPAPDRAGPSRPGPGSRARRRRRALTLLVVLGLVAAGAFFGGRFLLDSVVNPQCTISAGGMTETFDPEQTGNAALIAALSLKRDMPPRAATIALTTAIQESKIRNLRYGDRDSLGLFQQRPSQGWGSEEEILDPVYSTNTFFDALVKYKGYQSADITTIAQKVQKSGFPEAYRDHEGEGRVLASTLTGHSPAGLTCRLDAPTGSVGPGRRGRRPRAADGDHRRLRRRRGADRHRGRRHLGVGGGALGRRPGRAVRRHLGHHRRAHVGPGRSATPRGQTAPTARA